MLGLGALLYPQASDWYARRGHDAEISGYVRQIDATPEAGRREALDRARQYNAEIPEGVLQDPFTTAADTLGPDYLNQLNTPETEVMAELTYPKLGMSLPIYHGTAEDVISSGVGHLKGSSLPVGGPSTRSVLTSHSGLVHAELFTRLPEAKEGDIFHISVQGEAFYYRVNAIETVLPHQTGSLKVVNQKDLVTLITCTPIGVNSHRLFVHAERIDAPAGDTGRALAGDGLMAGFPWWLVLFLGGSVLAVYLIYTPPRPSGKHRLTTAQGVTQQ